MNSILTYDPVRFERLMSELSSNFIALPAQDIDGAIDDSLARIVRTLNIDRSTLSRVFPLTGITEVTHSFALDSFDPVPNQLPARLVAPWTLARALSNQAVVFERLDDLPPEAEIDKQTFRSIGLKSHVTMPIVVAGQLHGGLSFGCIREERAWPNDLLGRMRLLADVFGAALARKRAQEELDNAIGFERLASAILASLVLALPGQEDRAIALGLRDIGCFMAADQVTLWRGAGEGRFGWAQHWMADDLPGPAASTRSSSELPWISARIAAGVVVRLARLAELPAQAALDLAALRAIGVRSLLVVPISVSGSISGALSIASLRQENEWPDALTPGVSLLAEVFGSVHAREAAERRKQAAEVEAAHWRERLAHLVRVHTAGEMSVALAHEITQPLGAIENYAIAARRRASEPVPDMAHVIDLLDKVIGQATRAGDVVQRMRSMTQRHTLEPKAIDIRRAVEECVGMVSMDCDLRGIRIVLAPTGRLPVVMVDDIYLQQVLLNLLRNAMEAIELLGADDRRQIAITIGYEADELEVQVADSGAGIADGDLERVFESFYSTKSSGLGVGLAICRKLIEAHGGLLWASHRPGGGALFRFTLPVATPGSDHPLDP